MMRLLVGVIAALHCWACASASCVPVEVAFLSEGGIFNEKHGGSYSLNRFDVATRTSGVMEKGTFTAEHRSLCLENGSAAKYSFSVGKNINEFAVGALVCGEHKVEAGQTLHFSIESGKCIKQSDATLTAAALTSTMPSVTSTMPAMPSPMPSFAPASTKGTMNGTASQMPSSAADVPMVTSKPSMVRGYSMPASMMGSYSGSMKGSYSMSMKGSYSMSMMGSYSMSMMGSYSMSMMGSYSMSMMGSYSMSMSGSYMYSASGARVPATTAPTIFPTAQPSYRNPTKRPPTRKPASSPQRTPSSPPAMTSGAPTPTFNGVPNIPIVFTVTQKFTLVDTEAPGFAAVLQSTVSQIARVPPSAVTLVTASVFGQEEEEKKRGRALSSSTTVAYTLTVTPKMVQSSTPAAAYVSVSQALQQSVQPPAPGGSDSFTLMLVQLARTASNTGVTSKSVAGSLQISAYNSLSPTMQPTSTGRVTSSSGSSSGGGISEGTQVGIAFGVIGVVLVMVVAYFAYTRVHKDNIPERDVSMAAMQRNNEPFDSEQEQTVSPLPPAAAGGHHRKQSLIDIIPAAQFNPLATPGTDPAKRL